MPPRTPDAPAKRDQTLPQSGTERLRLGRAMRLGQNRDFTRVRQQGERLALGCLIVNWHRLPDGESPKLGVVTSRKIGGAVERSRARRLLRESFRQHQHEFAQPVELVLVARPSIAGRDFAGVERDFLAALNRGGLLKMTNS
jgi:ribonuclease P protein component